MAVNATAIWRVRPGGSNTNGGGYDPGIAGAGTDYSQHDAAQFTGTSGVTVGTADFADAGFGAFTSAMIGNAIYITGTGQTAGWYFVTAVPGATHVTLDRSPGTGTGATWNLGGGWADFWTNATSVPGNTIYILGSGTPNPSSYTYDYTAPQFTSVQGNVTAGFVTYANDPGTPGYRAPPDTRGGMPVIKSNATVFYNAGNIKLAGLYFVASGTGGRFSQPGSSGVHFGCVCDQFSYDDTMINPSSGGNSTVACEFFSSVAPGANGSNYAIQMSSDDAVIGCNVHDTVGPGIQVFSEGGKISLNIVAKCRGYGIQIADSTNDIVLLVDNNTIDANQGHGIEIGGQHRLSQSIVKNNIISNHVTAATYGITVDAGTAAANSLVQMLVDYNSFYNNTQNYNAVNAGPHDTALGVNPYVGQATENYTLA